MRLWICAKCDPMALKQLLFQKITKIAQRLGASPPDPIASGSGRNCPQTPANNTFELQYTFFTRHVSQFWHFHILTIGLSPLLKRVPGCVPTPGHGFWSSILRYLCPHKNSCFEVFGDAIARDLWFGFPPIKNPGYAYVPTRLWNSLNLGKIPRSQRWKPVWSTGRSGYWSGRESLTGRSSRLKHRSNSPSLQPKDI